MNFGDVGRICLNREIEEVCQNCLWLEWDKRRQQCNNWQYPICQLYRENLLAGGQSVKANAALGPADAGLEGPLAVKGREPGSA